MSFSEFIWMYLSKYGWFLTLFVIALAYVYYHYIAPLLDADRREYNLIQQKKFDEDVHSKVADKVQAARERQQRLHEAVSDDLRVREEEKKQRQLEELQAKIEKEHGKGAPVNAPSKAKPQPSPKKRSAQEIIDEYIFSRPVVMFSKSWCPFCRKAKTVLANFRLKSDEYEYIELDERDDLPGDAIQDEFAKRYGSRSVPKVFINGECIGGGDDTVKLFQDGHLEALVVAARANR